MTTRTDTRQFRHIRTPLMNMVLAVILALIFGVLACAVALRQPQIDIPIGQVVYSVNGQVLTPMDRLEEPDQLGDHAKLAQFLARQDQLAAALRGSVVQIGLIAASDIAAQTPEVTQIALTPRARHLTDLPFVFWFQWLVAAVALVFGAWVMAFRAADWGARMFALTGLSLAIAAASAAIYSTRQIALPADLFAVLSHINQFGSQNFGVALIGLFLLYPTPLVRPRFVWLPFVITNGLHLAYWQGLLPLTAPGLMLVGLLFTSIGIAIWQMRRNRAEPVSRAGLRWFFLLSLTGCSLFIGLSVVPAIIAPQSNVVMSQGYAFGFFTFMHLGLALGLTRFRLFDIDRYAYLLWIWLLSGVLVIALDLGLVALLRLSPFASLSGALLAAGLVYFPLRQMLLARLFKRSKFDSAALLPELIQIGMARTPDLSDAGWHAILTRIYEPLSGIEPVMEAPQSTQLLSDGLGIVIPASAGLAAAQLRYAGGGRRLFGPKDVEHINWMRKVVSIVADSRAAYERGATSERDRISRDVHDNIGAQILSALHTRESTKKDNLLRDTLQELRGIINRDFQSGLPLAEFWADMRAETAARTQIEGIDLIWQDAVLDQPSTLAPDQTLGATLISHRAQNHLRALLRETTSNTIKHAHASACQVVISQTDGMLGLAISDNGAAGMTAPQAPAQDMAPTGNGLGNLAQRCRQLGGQLTSDRPLGRADTLRGFGHFFEIPVENLSAQDHPSYDAGGASAPAIAALETITPPPTGRA